MAVLPHLRFAADADDRGTPFKQGIQGPETIEGKKAGPCSNGSPSPINST